MDSLVRNLPGSARVLDLGAARGSFTYASTRAYVLGVDLAFPAGTQTPTGRIIGDSAALPLKNDCLHVVVCNHVLEHFENLQDAVCEIDRVLKNGGRLWVAVPDGFSFDDWLYRYVFEGGGHVNRFTLESLIQTIEEKTCLRALSFKPLHSGFVYLNPPSPEKLPHYALRAQRLSSLPPKLLEFLLRWANFWVRVIDRYFGTQMSRYGWGVTFRRETKTRYKRYTRDVKELNRVPSDLNVCFSCGAGHPQPLLKPILKRYGPWRIYACPSCGKRNLFSRARTSLITRAGNDQRRMKLMPQGSLEQTAEQIFGTEDHDSIAKWVQYWEESYGRNKSLLEMFRGLVLGNFHGKNILDIGCGTGGMGDVVGTKGRLYVGADYNFHVLRFAKPRPDQIYVQCSAIELPFPNQSLDCIFAFDIIEHLVGGKTWQIQFLEELRRVLRPMGMIFLTTPNFWYPYEGHTGLYFPQYLPRVLGDKYIAWKNPGFLKEHRSFSEIQLLTPAALRKCLKESGLVFLHDLPCGLDRREFVHHFPVRGCLAYLGMGWYLHAGFWGILVRPQEKRGLRLKLKKHWYYEQNQPSVAEVPDFTPCIDFGTAPFSHQLGAGWYWHEKDRRGFRWIQREAVCYLQSDGLARCVKVSGFCPKENHFEVWLDGTRVGEHSVTSDSGFDVEYLIPFPKTSEKLFSVLIRCDQTFTPSQGPDKRQLGIMIFSVSLNEHFSSDI